MSTAKRFQPSDTSLRGVRVLSVALNLPGPAAVMRLADMGATCTKLEPLPPTGSPKGVPVIPWACMHRMLMPNCMPA